MCQFFVTNSLLVIVVYLFEKLSVTFFKSRALHSYMHKKQDLTVFCDHDITSLGYNN